VQAAHVEARHEALQLVDEGWLKDEGSDAASDVQLVRLAAEVGQVAPRQFPGTKGVGKHDCVAQALIRPSMVSVSRADMHRVRVAERAAPAVPLHTHVGAKTGAELILTADGDAQGQVALHEGVALGPPPADAVAQRIRRALLARPACLLPLTPPV